MPAPQSRPRQSKQLDAGGFQPEISSFRLHLAAEGKACKTVRTYTEAVAWFAAAHLRRETGLTSWEQVGKQDIQRWIVRLLDRYSSAYASNQYRALQQFFKWLAAEDEVPDPMAGLKPPRVPDKPCLHRRGPAAAGARLRGPRVHAAPRRRPDRRVPGDRDPPVGAGRNPVRR
jgi:integrase